MSWSWLLGRLQSSLRLPGLPRARPPQCALPGRCPAQVCVCSPLPGASKPVSPPWAGTRPSSLPAGPAVRVQGSRRGRCLPSAAVRKPGASPGGGSRGVLVWLLQLVL